MMDPAMARSVRDERESYLVLHSTLYSTYSTVKYTVISGGGLSIQDGTGCNKGSWIWTE